MRFANPQWLHWQWAVLLVILFFWWAGRRRRRLLGRFVDLHLAPEVVMNFHRRRIIFKQVLLVVVFILGLFALARPQWGFEWQEVKREGLDILIAMDTSKSMLAQDVKPNRLERAKLAVMDLLKKLQGDRIGVIAFAGDAFLMCPLTSDYNGVLLTLDSLDTRATARGGTNIGAAIDAAVKEYEHAPGKYKALVILTDGENLEGDPVAAARQAAAKGIKIYCIGIGTREGELIQVSDVFGEKEFLKDDQGRFVKSRLDEKTLQAIALKTGGIYVRSSGAQFGLDLIYEKELSKLEKREIKSKMEKRYFERFQIPLLAALLVLLLETCLSVYRERPS